MSKTGYELINEIGEYPTLDPFLDREAGRTRLSAEELWSLVGTLRGQRAAFITAQEKKKDKDDE